MPESAWEPVRVDELAELFADCDAPWWLAGGWAIDAHVGRQTRPHADIDVQVLRRGLPAVRRTLAGWDLRAADPPGSLLLWPEAETLPAQVHDVWCRPGPDGPWRLQLMVADSEPPATELTRNAVEHWHYRRDPRVSRPVSSLAGPASTSRLPVLAPEVQLLHASSLPSAKADADLAATLPTLDQTARRWLDEALCHLAPGHRWRRDLRA